MKCQGIMNGRGEVIIPKAIRDELGIKPCQTIEFKMQEDGILLRIVPDK